MSRLELRHLRYVLAVAEEGSFRAAAERLHLSQPPLSRQVQQVEDLVGGPLFERRASGIVLTAAGAAFMPEARRALAQADKAVQAARAAQQATAGGAVTLTIGFTSVFDAAAFPDVVKAYEARHPDVRLTVRRKPSIRLVRDLERGAMDVALIGLHTHAGSLSVIPLREEPVLVALPSAHPLAARRRLRVRDIGALPLFWFERRLNPGFHDHARALFEAWGYRPTTLPEPADHHVLLGLVAADEGIALAAASMRHLRRKGVVFRPLDADPPLTMGVALAHAPAGCSASARDFIALANALSHADGGEARPITRRSPPPASARPLPESSHAPPAPAPARPRRR